MDPTSAADPILRSAELALRSGNHIESERLCRQVLLNDPKNQQALLRIAMCAVETRRYALGIERFQELLRWYPNSLEGLNGLAILLRTTGRLAEAAEASFRAIQIDPSDAAAYGNLGLCHLDASDFQAAATALSTASKLRPSDPGLLHCLGVALHSLGRYDESANAYRGALALAPNSIASLINLEKALAINGETLERVQVLRRITALKPREVKPLLELASALSEAGLDLEADEALRRAFSVEPDSAEANLAKGRILQSRGSFQEAEELFSRAISKRPDWPTPYFQLAYSKKMTSENLEFVRVLEALGDAESTSPDGLLLIHFALGKAYQDLEQFDLAIKHFDKVNRMEEERLQGSGRSFSKEASRRQVDGIIGLFTKEVVRSSVSFASDSELPVLIVGMIRSGTSLVEQIVSSHGQIAGGGEIRFWGSKATELFRPPKNAFDPIFAGKVASDYLNVLRRISGSAARVTDKMPTNYLALGAFSMLFPRGKIIHCRRHPIDTAISIFTTPNDRAPDFSHTRENIIYAYRQYLRMMEHWRRVLPGGCMLEVDYESATEDLEPFARRMIEFVGLEWDESCLHFERNSRAVVTPSAWQVRQPIYRSSVDKWKRYQPWLGALAKLADPL